MTIKNKRTPRKPTALRPKIHAKLSEIAKQNHRTITGQIEFWVENTQLS